MDFNIAGLKEAASSHEDLITSTMSALNLLTDQGKSAGDSLVAAIQGGTDARGDTALSLETRKLGELSAQNKKAEFYKSIGMDLEGQAKISNTLATAFQANTRQALEQAQSIQDRESVGLLDNPVSYIWNQLILPDEKNALDATLKTGEVIKSSLNELNKALDETAKNEAEYSTKITAASVDSQVTGLKNNIDAHAQQAKMQAIQQNSHNLVTVLGADAQKLQMIQQVVSAQQSAAHLALAQETAGREREKFKQWQVEQKDTDDYITETTRLANKTATMMGKPELTRKEVALALKGKAQPGLAQTIQAYAANGYINDNSGALNNRYGETATASLDFVTSTKTPIPPAISEIYAEASKQIKAAIAAGTLDPKNKQVIDSEMNRLIAVNTKKLTAQIDSRDGTNPYRVPDLKVLASSTAVQNTKLFTEVLAPEVKAGGLTVSDPDTLISKGIVAVHQGKMTLGQLAQDLQTFYTAGVHANNEEKQFARFGMAAQTTYNAKVGGADSRTVLGSPELTSVNMLDLADINKVLVKRMASQRMGQSGLWR